jgi:hypothetical protein
VLVQPAGRVKPEKSEYRPGIKVTLPSGVWPTKMPASAVPAAKSPTVVSLNIETTGSVMVHE